MSGRVRSALSGFGPLRAVVMRVRVERRRRQFAADLRRLNDALAGSPLDGRWWVFGGMLLGWAREGRLLDHDLIDADFAYRDEDHERFLAAVPTLVAAGFEPLHRYVSNDGLVTIHRFVRGRGRFEFFRLVPVEGGLRFWMHDGREPPTEYAGDLTDQCVSPFRFLGRTWLKSEDHEAELAAMYGDWRTPDPGFDYPDEPCIVSAEPWRELRKDWPYAAELSGAD